MKHIKLVTAAAFVMGLGAIGSANAVDGLITFTGSITDATCVVSGGTGTDGGQGNFIVALDPAPNSDFSSVGDVAKRKDFNVNVGPATPGGTCTGGTTGSARMFFQSSSPNVNVAGRLNNIANAGAATGVDLQVLDNTGTAINLSTPGAGLQTVAITSNTATLTYGVQYFATAAAVTPGGVRSNVIYTVEFI